MTHPYLLFDAGGTLVFPHQEVLAQTAAEFAMKVSLDQIFALYCQIIYDIDDYARRHGELPELYPHGYAWEFYHRLGLRGSHLAAAAEKIDTYNRQHNLWAYTFPWMRAALQHLQDEGYHMSVISNADGRAAQIFRQLQLANFFEQIFDSHILGVEKPDPTIFEMALDELGLSPAEAVYIGDVFYIDTWGANHAGLAGIHLDPLGLYRGWPGVHIPDIRHLAAWLAQHDLDDPALRQAGSLALRV